MFPKNQRITSLEFDSLLKKGKTYQSLMFSLCRVTNTKPQVAVVASKKVSKKAVIRNKNKRRVRHQLKSIIKQGFLGYFIIFIKKDLSKIKPKDLKNDLETLINKSVL